jgi:hypothetical protein
MSDLTLIVIALALLWIAWELHRMVREFREFMGGFVEGYAEAVAKRQGN